jgi:isopentenyldiphosphate isomerase
MADDERLDYYDGDGAHLGVAPRRAVHHAGYWHRTLHLWLTSEAEGGSLLYQLRARTAGNWPGLLDASVAGHLLAGEDYAAAMREAREEIGITIPPEAAVLLGVRREVDPATEGGCNRELQGVHLARLDPDWGDFAGVDREADGIAWVNHDDGLRLHRGAVATIVARVTVFDRGETRDERRQLRAADFVPQRDDYYLRMHEIAAKLLRGEPLPPLAG